MIYINHERKAIFIHIPKTGGSYIGPTLTKYYGFISYLKLIALGRPDHDEVCKTSVCSSVLTGNYLYDNSLFNKTIGLLEYCSTSDYFNSKMNMNEEKWATYTKFCFIRNPYSRVVSGWRHFNTILNKNQTVFEYLSNPDVSDIEYGHIFMSQRRHIQDKSGHGDGICGVDIIGRFEHLEDDLRVILQTIGFQHIVHPVQKVNVSNTSGSDDVSMEIRTIKLVNQLFADDFNAFHYQMISI